MVEIEGKDALFYVSGSTPVDKLGSAIAHGVYSQKNVQLRAIGAAAVSQAQKAVAAAIGFTAPRGYRLATIPSFAEVQMPDRTVTAMVFKIVIL
jgi:stage V sporulation protein SpoVS